MPSLVVRLPAQLGARNAEFNLQLDTLLAQDVFLQLLHLDGPLLGVQQSVRVSEGESGGGEYGQRQPGERPTFSSSLVSVQYRLT